jgi:uncharacterized protein (TIGR00369 family)
MSQPSVRDILPQIMENTPYMKAIGAQFDRLEGDTVSLVLPYRADLIGDPQTGVIAPGVVTGMLDQGCGLAVWARMNEFKPVATLDLRIDYMRPARRGERLRIEAACYKLTKSMGFVRGFAFDETGADDPVAAAQAAFVITTNTVKS